MKRSFKFGQSLIEVVIAMAIVIAAAVALVSTTIFTQKSARSANSQVLATKLAEEGIEKMRVFRDRHGFDKVEVRPCSELISSSADISAWTFVACGAEGEVITLENVRFVREIFVCENNSAPCSGTPNIKRKVRVTIKWIESGGERSVLTETFFSRF